MTTPTFEPVELPSRYAKAFVAILTAVLAVLVTALTDNVVTLVEVIGISVAGVTAVGVYLVPNLDAGPGRHLKLIVAVIGTGLQAAGPLVLNDGAFPPSAWLLVLLAALGAVSVGITPNAPPVVSTLAYRGVGAAVNMPGGSTVTNRTGEPELLYDPNPERHGFDTGDPRG